MTVEQQVAFYKARCEYLAAQVKQLEDMVERLCLDIGIRESPIKPLEETEEKE